MTPRRFNLVQVALVSGLESVKEEKLPKRRARRPERVRFVRVRWVRFGNLEGWRASLKDRSVSNAVSESVGQVICRIERLGNDGKGAM